MPSLDRRSFLQLGGAAAVAPFAPGTSAPRAARRPEDPEVSFAGDGIPQSPQDYAQLLARLAAADPQIEDVYGSGGAVKRLEAAFATLTGKERAVFVPTGTLANQLAIAVLARDKTKVFVQEQSHIYRDEADAAQSVFGKRLMPLVPDRCTFTLEDLKAAIDDYHHREVFESGVGALAIENPVRRRNGEVFDFGEMKRVTAYAKEHGIGTHLDGARLFLASAYSGVSVRDYAALFDTVYISLYKYFGAGAGAVLCGSAELMATIPHLIKVHGGTMLWNWHNAAVALHNLDGFVERYQRAKVRADELFALLNQIDGIHIEPLPHGSNIFQLKLTGIDGRKFAGKLREQRIRLRPPADGADFAPLMVNESVLATSNDRLVAAFKQAAGK
jgi:threonine aldolase